MSKKNVQALHTATGDFVLGEVMDVSPGSIVLRQPLVARRHPAINAVFLVRYQPFGDMRDSQITFLTNSLVSYFVPDKDTYKLYIAGVKGLRDAEKADRKAAKGDDSEFTIIRPGQQVTSPTTQLEPVEEELSIEDLRRTTTRMDD